MAEFKKFNSITLLRPERTEEVQKLTLGFGDKRCYVTEKIHGANFTVWTDGTQFKFGRRNDWLEPDDDFYGYQFISGILENKVGIMFKDLQEMADAEWAAYDDLLADGETLEEPSMPRKIESLKITGEFCGGFYPDAPVVKQGSGQVGKGKIWYTQQKTFYAFEMAINDEIQDVYQLGTLCVSYGIPVVPILCWGSFEECMEFSKEHINDNTIVPNITPMVDTNGKLPDDIVALPMIEGNIREGHVIATVTPDWFHNGKRMMVKHKGDKYAETAKKDKQPRLVEFNEHQQHVFDTIMLGVTENRLEAVMSKEADITPKAFPKIIGMVVEDSIECSWNDGFSLFAYHLGLLSTKERKQVTKRANREAALALRKAYFS